MKIIEEVTKIYQAKDGAKFKDRQECLSYEKGIPYSIYCGSLSNLKSFHVTENHLKLVKRIEIDWSFIKGEYNAGYFYQDTKRPYGNSDWLSDIGEILGIDPDCHSEDDFENKFYSESLEYFLVCQHIDMKVVMEILCQNLSIKIGHYKRDSIFFNWEYAG